MNSINFPGSNPFPTKSVQANAVTWSVSPARCIEETESQPDHFTLTTSPVQYTSNHPPLATPVSQPVEAPTPPPEPAHPEASAVRAPTLLTNFYESTVTGTYTAACKVQAEPLLSGQSIVTLELNEYTYSGARTAFSYTGLLSALDDRYPGLCSRLKEAEGKAWVVNLFPGGPTTHTTRVLESPPWPTTDFGSSRTNVQEKAGLLLAANPQLSSQKVQDYDFAAAQDRAGELFEDMDKLFPESEFQGAKFATRAKTPQSLENKLAKRAQEDPSFTLAHLTDTVGGRLDCTNLKMLGQAATRLEAHYGDKIVAKDDYLTRPGALGYRALHYIVDLGDRMAEIQLSTNDLRAADLATHDTLYKPHFEIDQETAQKLSGAADRIMEAESYRYLMGYS